MAENRGGDPVVEQPAPGVRLRPQRPAGPPPTSTAGWWASASRQRKTVSMYENRRVLQVHDDHPYPTAATFSPAAVDGSRNHLSFNLDLDPDDADDDAEDQRETGPSSSQGPPQPGVSKTTHQTTAPARRSQRLRSEPNRPAFARSKSDMNIRVRNVSFEAQQTLPEVQENVHKCKRVYKVIVIGDVHTGKSSLIRRYVHNYFCDRYRATIGLDFSLKLIHYNDDMEVRLQLWDIAGQERFSSMTRTYYKGTVGAVVVFDQSSDASFESVRRWKADLDSKCQLPGDGCRKVPAILICNKSDLPSTTDDEDPPDGDGNDVEISKFAVEHGFIPTWYRTSAKTGKNVREAMNLLLKYILAYDTWNEPWEATKDCTDETTDGAGSSGHHQDQEGLRRRGGSPSSGGHRFPAADLNQRPQPDGQEVETSSADEHQRPPSGTIWLNESLQDPVDLASRTKKKGSCSC